ncbi:hypothetical protein ACLMAL_28755 [Nocardia sp. CWNU-33]
MTSEPDTNRPEDPETKHDDADQPESNDETSATTEDQAANMDYEGDTPN